MRITGIANNNFGANYSAIVKNPLGLHIRPSGQLAKITACTDKPIYFSTKVHPERNVRASMLSVLTTEATQGREIFVRTEDNYPKDIIKVVLDFITAPNDNAMSKIFDDFMAKFLH